MVSRNTSDWIDGYVDFTSETEPPELYRRWVAVSVIAANLQRRCYMQWGMEPFYPNMFIVLVGPSGKCRKGTAMRPGLQFLRGRGENVKLCAEAITREALIRELKGSKITSFDEFGRETHHCSLTIYSQELTVFLGYSNHQLMADIADWYDCGDVWTYRTKTQGEDVIRNLWVNLIGATTPALISTTLPRDAIGGGLTSRIIFVYADKKGKIVPLPFLSEEQMELQEKLAADLETIAMLRGGFKATRAFVNRWVDWYTHAEANPPFHDDRLAGYIQRRQTHVMKLSMIMCASRSNDMVVDICDFDEALSLLRRTEKVMPRVFRGIGANVNVGVLERIIGYISHVGVVTYSDLLRRFYYDADSAAMDDIITTLRSMDRIEVHLDKTGTRTIKWKGDKP